MKTERSITSRRLALWLLAGAGGTVVSLVAWLQWKPIRYDPNEVLPELLALEEPYREVHATIVLDGGSVPIRIVDARGQVFQCCLDVRDSYRTVHIGVRHYSDEAGTATTASEDTKAFLEKCLRRHDASIWVRQALAYWRPRPFDYVKFVTVRLTDPAWERQR